MANALTKSELSIDYAYSSAGKLLKEVTIDWTADTAANDPEIFTTTIELPAGFIINMYTTPGSPAPTNSYGILLISPFGSLLDILGSKGLARSATLTEILQPVRTDEATPVFVKAGIYVLRILGNVVAGAKGTIVLDMIEAT